MTASEVKVGSWFMILRSKQWYKKVSNGNTYVSCTVPTDNKEYLVRLTEEVTTQ